MQEGLDLGYLGWMYDYGEYVSPHTTVRFGISCRVYVGMIAHHGTSFLFVFCVY